MANNDIILYLNTPFCIQQPAYSQKRLLIGSSAAKAEYLDALKREVLSAAEDFSEKTVKAVYLGGNPSIMRADMIGDLMATIRKNYHLAPHCEMSIEALPNTICVPSLTGWGSGKPNRINLNIHSTNPKELNVLNCPFDVSDIQNAVLFLDKFHVNNVNLNLTYGIPGQTKITWKQTLRSALDLEPFHITLSPLLATGEGIASEEEQLEWYQIACEYLYDQGLRQYSVNQFTTNQSISHYHYQKYQGCAVVGFGLDAHSAYDGYIYSNTSDYRHYILHSDDASQIITSPQEMDQKYLTDRFLYHSLFLLDGFSNDEYHNIFGCDLPEDALHQLTHWQEQHLVQKIGPRYHLTPLGMFRWKRM